MIAALVAAGGLVAGGAAMARPRCLPATRSTAANSSTSANSWAGISIVIPARNAETTIVELLASLERGQVAEVIVVDDASTDATAALAAAHGARVVRLDGDPPAGWTGKAHACDRGAAVATGPLLLFLDADVTMREGAIGGLLDAHARHGGLISVQPYHRIERPYETLSAVCNVIAIMGSGAFATRRRARRPAAFGPCLLTSRDDYERIGGHAGVRGDVVEDVALARRFDAIGLPVTVFSGWGAVEFRMYPDGLRQLIEGWTKNLASGVRLVDPVMSVIAVWWICACIALTVNAAQELAGGAGGVAVALVSWAAVAYQLRWMWRRVGSFGWLTALTYPIATIGFVVLFVRSAWATLVKRRVRWSGRPIELASRRAS